MKQEELFSSISKMLEEHIKQNNITEIKDISKLKRNLWDFLAPKNVGEKAVDNKTQINAPNAVVEVVDNESGEIFRRYLELEYKETSNGIRLSGEDMKGDDSEIIFLSNNAIEKLFELKGDGPDKPRCDH